MAIGINDIVKDLEESGIKKNDTILVHSSLKSIGFVEGGADTVIDALLELLGKDGTLLMPSFQNGSEFLIVERGCIFDVRNSPSELGKITETFRNRPEVIRSLSPTHCTAAIGKNAEKILADHEKCNVSCGWGSPYHKICKHHNAKIVLLGVTHSSNTTLHFLENVNGAPTVSQKQYEPIVIDTKGNEITVPTYPNMPGLGRKYTRVEPILLEAGAQKNGKVGQAECRVIQAQAMFELVGNIIKQDPLFLIDVFTPSE